MIVWASSGLRTIRPKGIVAPPAIRNSEERTGDVAISSCAQSTERSTLRVTEKPSRASAAAEAASAASERRANLFESHSSPAGSPGTPIATPRRVGSSLAARETIPSVLTSAGAVSRKSIAYARLSFAT